MVVSHNGPLALEPDGEDLHSAGVPHVGLRAVLVRQINGGSIPLTSLAPEAQFGRASHS